MTASSADLRDYQDYALGGDEHARLGDKLALAQRYLQRHPTGAWAEDVRAEYDQGEAKYFARAQDDRQIAMEYLTVLPNGPHAPQLVFVVNAFDTKQEDSDERSARLTEQDLAGAARDRQEAIDWITSAIAAEITDTGAEFASTLPLVKLVIGEVPPTWGERSSRDREFAYVIPAKRGRDPHAVATRLALHSNGGVIVAADFRGADLFVRWTELDALKAKDETRESDRQEARAHVADVLSGMLERRFPAATCVVEDDKAVIARRCGGLDFRATMGEHAGQDDVISVSTK